MSSFLAVVHAPMLAIRPSRALPVQRKARLCCQRTSVRSHASKADRNKPWNFGFQCNERYLEWGESGHARFLKLHCAKELGWSSDKIEAEIQNLISVLPGLELRLARMKADLLLRLLTHQNRIAENMITLRRELPAVDVANAVSRYPALLTDMSSDAIMQSIAAVREALPGLEEIDGVIDAEPRILTTDIPRLLTEIERILPGQDPQKLLAANPSGYMDMASQGLLTSLVDEPGLQALPNHSKG